MNLRRRVEALESALRPRAEPFADPQYAVALELGSGGRSRCHRWTVVDVNVPLPGGSRPAALRKKRAPTGARGKPAFPPTPHNFRGWSLLVT